MYTNHKNYQQIDLEVLVVQQPVWQHPPIMGALHGEDPHRKTWRTLKKIMSK